MGGPSRLDKPSGPASEAWRPWYWTRRWKRRRAEQLHAPPLCVICLNDGVWTPATIADHIEPHRGDPVKFWFGELQSLCETHHKRDKRLIEAGRPLLGVDDDGWPADPRSLANGGTGTLSRQFEERRFPSGLKPSAIPLTIVTGRPGSGKSTYVARCADRADQVIDLDAIISEISGLPIHHRTSGQWLTPGLEERNRRLRALHTATHACAWFVVTAPEPAERTRWAQHLGGRLVVMDTPVDECIRRIKADDTRSGQVERMIEAARIWR